MLECFELIDENSPETKTRSQVDVVHVMLEYLVFNRDEAFDETIKSNSSTSQNVERKAG